MHRDFHSELGFVCPVEQSERAGRQVPEGTITSMYDIRELKQTTTATPTRTSPNKRLNDLKVLL